MSQDEFTFLEVGDLVDGELYLVLVDTSLGDNEKGHVPAYSFEMRVQNVDGKIGHVNLRIGNTEHVRKYAGHIGYGVDPEYRGRRYAARSCRLVFPLALRHGINPVWITCNPDNLASRRTCEIAGGVYVETVDVPPDSPVYERGEFKKCRYRFDLLPGFDQ